MKQIQGCQTLFRGKGYLPLPAHRLLVTHVAMVNLGLGEVYKPQETPKEEKVILNIKNARAGRGTL